MNKQKKARVILSAFVGLILSSLGVSQSDLANKIPWVNQEKLSLGVASNDKMCSTEDRGGNIPLFVSCAGFLE